MDVLLINPKNIKSQVHGLMPPLGLNSIGNMIEANSLAVKILDLELYPTSFDLFTYIKDLAPKIVVISGTSQSRFESFRIANIIKKVSSALPTVYGGCHATFTAVDTLSHIRDIDYIVQGEGEATLLELVNFLILGKGEIKNIAGLSYRGDGQIRQNPARQRIFDLDSIPFSRHLLEMDKYTTKLEFLNLPAISIITSRGCPYNCSFCSASAMFGKIYTMRSAKQVVDEIEYCVENFKIRGIKFFDSTLTLNRKHVLSLINELKTRNINLPWECEIRVDTVDESLLKAMKEAGCYYVNFGVESINEKVSQTIGKSITLKQIIEVMQWCKKLDLKTMVFFSFGHIGETWSDSKATFAFINKYIDYISHLSVTLGIKIFPGTYLEQYARTNGLLPPSFSWSEPFDNWQEGPIVTDNVPILIQPNYGLKELKKCYSQLYKTELRRDLKNPLSIFGKLANRFSRAWRMLISSI
ncbi:B12-binding domain-containing radical SAM protein [Candidatus Margulisiibacteriota bacterium]